MSMGDDTPEVAVISFPSITQSTIRSVKRQLPKAKDEETNVKVIGTEEVDLLRISMGGNTPAKFQVNQNGLIYVASEDPLTYTDENEGEPEQVTFSDPPPQPQNHLEGSGQKTYEHVTNMPISDSEEENEEINFYSEGLSNHATSYVPS